MKTNHTNIGETYNNITVIDNNAFKPKNRHTWHIKVKCSCGTIFDACERQVKFNCIKYCSECALEYKAKVFVGTKIKNWTISSRAFKYGKSGKLWHVKCNCGNEDFITITALKHNKHDGCNNCINMRNAVPYNNGDKVNCLTILDNNLIRVGTDTRLRIKVQCKCGNIFTPINNKIRNNIITQCRNCDLNDVCDLHPGDKLGVWTIVDNQVKHNKYMSRLLHVRCKCGNESFVKSTQLKLFNKYNDGCVKCSQRDKNMLCGNITKGLFGYLKGSAVSRNLEFSVTPEFLWELFLKQNKTCALSGILIDIINRHDIMRNKTLWNENTASLDRINSSEGYTHINVQWVHKDVNLMKMQLNENTFINYCKLIAEHKK